jgi:hypothetical protein
VRVDIIDIISMRNSRLLEEKKEKPHRLSVIRCGAAKSWPGNFNKVARLLNLAADAPKASTSR